MLCERNQVSEVTGTSIDRPGLFFPRAGWVQPVIDQGFRFERRDIKGNDLVKLQQEFDQVILAPGWNRFELLAPLGLAPVRGQSIEAGLGKTRLKTMLGGKLAAIPTGDGSQCVAGSTYGHGDEDLSERVEDSYRIARPLEQLLKDDVEVRETYTGIRCATRDRQPIAGALPDWGVLQNAIRSIGINKRGFVLPDGLYQSGTWVLTGLGSHGSTTAPLLGEYVARLITGEASCLTCDWGAQLDAARFQLRDAGLRRYVRQYRPR
jgi:tRNA 5-methylaminomethyl-2-thiouridine biosynthesis bifunctional protein